MKAFDIDIEKAVLGAFMLSSSTCGEQIEAVRSIWFSDLNNQLICGAIKQLYRDNGLIDLITVNNALNGEIKAYELAKIANTVASTSNVSYHIRILQQLWTTRELQNIGLWLGQQTDSDPFQTVAEVKTKLNELELTRDYKVKNIIELVTEQTKELDRRRKSEVKTVGLPSGSYSLDKYIGGLVSGELIICAGRPGMGKTAFAVSLGIEHCRRGGATLMFSIEMPEQQIADRVISSGADINNMKIRNADLSDYDMIQIKGLNLPDTFFINDNSRLDIDNIGAVVKAVKARENITFVVIDYMQLIRSESKGRNREQEVAYISNTCKRIAKECSVCVMALAQLSRDVEKRGGNKIPQLSDLRESGSIEQDADVVLFPFRPDYYLLGDENHNPAEIEDAKVIVAKCRNGMTGYIDVKFKPSTTQYIL